jgi:pimeloyl-ACP methyl ester carboxylesterase
MFLYLFSSSMASTLQEIMVEVDPFQWFCREAFPQTPEDRPPVVLLHGLPSQSYSWLPILNDLADQGFRAFAPDWLGFGLSDKPAPFEFDYKPGSYLAALHSFFQSLELKRFSLVVQGFLGSVGLQYALRHPDQIERLVILNTPLLKSARLPWKIQQLGLPLLGDMLTQDPLLVDRTLEGGGIYQVPDKDLDVYRRPWLKSSAAGRSLLAVVRNLQLSQSLAEIETGFSTWTKPTLVIWGLEDPWLSIEMAETFVNPIRSAALVKLEQLGHYPQQDWYQKVSEVMIPFLRKLIV